MSSRFSCIKSSMIIWLTLIPRIFFSRNYKCYVNEQQAIVTTNVGENFYSCSDQHMFMRICMTSCYALRNCITNRE